MREMTTSLAESCSSSDFSSETSREMGCVFLTPEQSFLAESRVRQAGVVSARNNCGLRGRREVVASERFTRLEKSRHEMVFPERKSDADLSRKGQKGWLDMENQICFEDALARLSYSERRQ